MNDNDELLGRSGRKAGNKVFTAIANGDFDSDEYEEMLGRPASASFFAI